MTSRRQLYLVIILIFAGLFLLFTFLYQKYWRVSADTNNQWVKKSTSQITHQYNGREYVYNLLTMANSGVYVDVYQMGAPTGGATNFKGSKIFLLGATNYKPYNFPQLAVVTDAQSNKILMTGFYAPASNVTGTSNSLNFYRVYNPKTPDNNSNGASNGVNTGTDYIITNLGDYSKATGSNQKVSNLNKATWWHDYYLYIASLKNVLIIDQSQSNLPQALTTVHESCKDKLLTIQPATAQNQNLPSEISEAVNLIKTKWGMKDFDPISLLGGGNIDTYNRYIMDLNQEFQLQNPKQPLDNFDIVKGELLASEQNLSDKETAIMTKAEADGTMGTEKWICSPVALISAYGGFAAGGGIRAILPSAALGEVGCLAFAKWSVDHIRSIEVQDFLKALANSLFIADYSIHYINYLYCVAEPNNDNPSDLKTAINTKISYLNDQLKGLQDAQASGIAAAADTPTGFWATLLKGLTDTLKDVMTSTLRWAWNLLLSAPL